MTITVHTVTPCQACVSVKRALRSRGHDFTEAPTTDDLITRAVQAGFRREAPIVCIDGEPVFTGFDITRMDKHFPRGDRQ